MSCGVSCDPSEVALKNFFLDPQSENANWVNGLVQEVLNDWFAWRGNKIPAGGCALSPHDKALSDSADHRQQVLGLLRQVTRRFQMEVPKSRFSAISLPALAGHILTLLHNPDTNSNPSASLTLAIENEAVDALAQMLGLGSAYGHFTSGGTVANFEAVVRASARAHAWMAMGAVSGGVPLFEAAHMGWERFGKGLARVAKERLTPYLPELSGPWAAGRALERAFNTPFCGPVLIVPRHGHHSWKKAARLFGVGEANLRYVDGGPDGRYSIDHLEQHLLECHRGQQPVLAVVSVTGTSETGTVDPVHAIQNLLDQWKKNQGLHIWHHVDAACGGFFCTLLRQDPSLRGEELENPLGPSVIQALSAVGRGDSVTVAPHYLGYLPNSSGAFLARHRDDYTCVQTLAPTTDNPRDPHTLEGTRSAAGAVAIWLTARSVGLHQSGYGLLMARILRHKQQIEQWLLDHVPGVRIYPGCDTHLLCFCVAHQGEPVSHCNERALRIAVSLPSESTHCLSKTHFPVRDTGVTRDFIHSWNGQTDADQLVVLRLSLTNPFFDVSEHLALAFSEQIA